MTTVRNWFVRSGRIPWFDATPFRSANAKIPAKEFFNGIGPKLPPASVFRALQIKGDPSQRLPPKLLSPQAFNSLCQSPEEEKKKEVLMYDNQRQEGSLHPQPIAIDIASSPRRFCLHEVGGREITGGQMRGPEYGPYSRGKF